MNGDVKDVLEEFFIDAKDNTDLQEKISRDDMAQVFLLKVSRAIEQEKESPSLGEKQRDMLFFADVMLGVYEDIVKPASKTYVEIINNMIGEPDVEKLMKVMENPLYQNSFVYVGNDNIQHGLSKEEITQLRHTGSLSSITPILEQSEKFYNEMSAQAHFNYGSVIDTTFSKKSEKEQNAINDYINEHPKEIMALSFIAEESRKAGNEVNIYNADDLRAKCEIKEVIDLASKISYIERNESLEKCAKEAKPLKGLDKVLAIGENVKTVSMKDNSRSA
ncbi:MAG: hypothetical protein IJZ30_01230 [Alphaproteobacteria bacterium]|nr:hypothetical protein [Alphaproteobacteria bacterium]